MSNKKLYDIGLICGRFSHLHLGHFSLIETSRKLCNKTLILVGSAQESKTLRNPFTIDTRINVIKTAFPDISSESLIVDGLNDLTNEFDFSVNWGEYVKENVENIMGKFADLIIYGDDESRNKWFTKDILSNVSELVIPREKHQISATILRGYLVIDDKSSWEKITPNSIHHMYETLQEEIMSVKIYKDIYDSLGINNKSIEDYIKVYKKYEEKDKLDKLSQIKSIN